MTPKQRTYINDIENGLSVNHQGRDAHEFITQHEDEFFHYRKDQGIKVPPSSRQLEFIHKIQYVLQVQFTGTTSDDAYEFINKHIKEYRKNEPSWLKNSQFNKRCGSCDRSFGRTNWKRK